MIDLFREIDFVSKDVSKDAKEDDDKEDDDKEYTLFLREAAKTIAGEEIDTLRKIKRPEFDEELQNHLIVTGIPVVTTVNKEKFIKFFESFITKKKIGLSNGLLSIDAGMENDVGNQTLYLVYKEAAEAKAAFKKLNNLKFDKDHTLLCFTVKQIQQVMKFKPEYKAPELISTEEKRSFNWDEEHRNQFAVLEGQNLMVRWLDHLDKSSATAIPEEYIKNDEIKPKKIGFSPKGTYLTVCCQKATYLYGGKDMKLKGTYLQQAPIDFKFSQNERYLVTFNGSGIKNKENFVIFAVQEEIRIKSFRSAIGQTLDVFQFNHDSSNLAIAMTNQIYFYSLSSVEHFVSQLRLSEEDSEVLKVNYVQKLAWLRDNKSVMVICYEIDYNPNSMAITKVFIYDFKNKIERKWRTWGQHVKKGEIVVSQRGDWVAVIMKKFIKKNHFSTVIQIGNLLKHEDPIEISSVEIKEQVGNVSWDFKGNRFAVIHEDESTRHGINVRYILELFQITTKGKNLNFAKLHETKNILSNRVTLASSGSFLVTYNLSETSPQRGKISFGLIAKDKSAKKINIEWIKENVMIHQLSFFKLDPSGRFVLMGTEKTYQIWNMIGQLVTKDTLVKDIHDVEWRPRLINKLEDKEEDKLVSEEKSITKKYQEEDLNKLDKLRGIREKNKKIRAESFMQYLASKRDWSAGFGYKRKNILSFDQVQARTATYEVIADLEEL